MKSRWRVCHVFIDEKSKSVVQVVKGELQLGVKCRSVKA